MVKHDSKAYSPHTRWPHHSILLVIVRWTYWPIPVWPLRRHSIKRVAFIPFIFTRDVSSSTRRLLRDKSYARISTISASFILQRADSRFVRSSCVKSSQRNVLYFFLFSFRCPFRTSNKRVTRKQLLNVFSSTIAITKIQTYYSRKRDDCNGRQTSFDTFSLLIHRPTISSLESCPYLLKGTVTVVCGVLTGRRGSSIVELSQLS